MAHNNATWNSNFGYAPIEKEEFYIGSGDSRPYWYQCCECRRKYGDTKPLQNTVCGQTLVLYSKEKLRFSITESFPFLCEILLQCFKRFTEIPLMLDNFILNPFLDDYLARKPILYYI